MIEEFEYLVYVHYRRLYTDAMEYNKDNVNVYIKFIKKWLTTY